MNQYAGAKLTLKNGDPIEELRFGKGRELALSSSTGEFNASDRKDLLKSISSLMQAVQSEQVVPAHKAMASSEERRQVKEERRELLAAAYNDTTGNLWSALGASLAEQIHEQAAREGFMRRVMMGNTLKQGEVARIPMPAHDTIAVVATSSSSVGYQVIRNKMFQPAEFEILANIRVEALDIEQVSSDILDDAYNQGLEALMVAEDRLWKKAADEASGIVNPLEYIAGPLTPQILGQLRQSVTDWNLPVTTAIISNDFWSDIVGSNDFATFLDPVTKYDLATNGVQGSLVGMQLITDGFRQPNLKVLGRGELYVVSAPENHGTFTDRGGVRSVPVDGSSMGNTSKGFLLSEFISLTLANAKSLSRAKRI
jgi:hypothetical protein